MTVGISNSFLQKFVFPWAYKERPCCRINLQIRKGLPGTDRHYSWYCKMMLPSIWKPDCSCSCKSGVRLALPEGPSQTVAFIQSFLPSQLSSSVLQSNKLPAGIFCRERTALFVYWFTALLEFPSTHVYQHVNLNLLSYQPSTFWKLLAYFSRHRDRTL